MYGAEIARDTVGSFLVLVEKDTMPALSHHFPSGWTKIHLSFTTSENRVNVALTDNGASLVIKTELGSCTAFSRFHHYGVRRGHSRLYGDMAAALRRALEACPGARTGAEQYQREFQQAEHDYPAAMQAMLARVDTTFRQGRARCQYVPRDDDEAWRRCLDP
jgi:hypothetical protein